MVKAETDLRARESEHQQQQSKLERVVRQVAACRIVAPDAGMVVYATTGGRGGNREPLRVGQDVSERQELINLPSGDAMNVEVKVQESNLRKVREGQTVLVRVDALPGDVFRGRLTRIGLLPDSTRAWLKPDLKVYNCIVELDAPSAKLRPGMGCRAEIVVQELDNAVFVPVQAVIRVKRRPTVYVVGKGPAVPRAIEIGLDNNRMVHVIRGLQPGEQVSLTPPLAEGEEPAADASSQAPQRAPEPGASSADGPPPGAAFTNGPPRRRGGERPGAGAPDSRHGRRPPA
jgi:HlyD family secretion protein